MNRGRRRLVSAGMLGLVVSCATVPPTIEIPRERIEAALARRFPYREPAGELLTVEVGLPRVDLLPEVNRVRLTAAFDVSERITRAAMRGDVVLSFALRFEPSDASVRLVDVELERIDVQGVPQRWRRPVEAIAAYMGQHLLETYILYRFTPAQLARAQGGRPGAIRVTSTGISIELLPS